MLLHVGLPLDKAGLAMAVVALRLPRMLPWSSGLNDNAGGVGPMVLRRTEGTERPQVRAPHSQQ